MSNQLEQIVRPSQSPLIRPAIATQIYAIPKIPDNEPVEWGSAGDTVFELHAHAEDSLDRKWPEEKRTYDVVRVYNPDDRSQFFDTEVMTEYQGRNKISQDRIVMQFATNSNTKNTEVMERGLVRKTSGTS